MEEKEVKRGAQGAACSAEFDVLHTPNMAKVKATSPMPTVDIDLIECSSRSKLKGGKAPPAGGRQGTCLLLLGRSATASLETFWDILTVDLH